MRENYLWIALAVLVTASAIAGYFLLPTYLEGEMLSLTTGSPTLEDLGSAGEFTNVKWGIPLAVVSGLIAAAVGGLLSWTLTRASARQGEIDILEFAENKSRHIGERFAPLTQAMMSAVKFGNMLQRELVDAVLNDPEPRDLNRIRQRFIENCAEHLEHFRASIESLKTSTSDVWSDPYATLVTEFGLSRRPRFKGHMRAMARAMTELQTDASEYELLWLSEADPREVARLLSAERPVFRPERAFAVVQLLPWEAHSIEYAGLLLNGRVHRLRAPVSTSSGGEIETVVFNTGAAMLLSVVDSLPNRKEVSELIDELLDKRSEIARKFLSQAGPDWSSHAPSSRWMTGFDKYSSDDCFIIVRVKYGDTVRSEYFNRQEHGALFQETA